jgi:hypothetical protein
MIRQRLHNCIQVDQELALSIDRGRIPRIIGVESILVMFSGLDNEDRLAK